MGDLYLILDESGSKGYSENKEKIPGEFGILAGYFVRPNLIERVRDDFTAIRERFLVNGTAKMHLTDLRGQRDAARTAVLSYFAERGMGVIYEAAYVQGLHRAVGRQNEISDQARKERKEHNPTTIIHNRPVSELLISELFGMLFGKAAAYGVDHFGKQTTLNIIMDRTDEALLTEFRKGADVFLNAGTPKEREVKGYDTALGKKFLEPYKISVTGPDLDKAKNSFKEIRYALSDEDSGLTFAADVLANSLNHHLRGKVEQTIGMDLNSQKAITGYQLADYFYGMADNSSFTSFTDMAYVHPDRKKDA